MPDRVREATLPRLKLPQLPQAQESAAHRAVFEPTAVPFPWAGIGAAVGGVGFAFGSRSMDALALVSVAFSLITVGLALRASVEVRRDVGWLPWMIGPLGASLAALAGLIQHNNEHDSWVGLAGAAVAAGAMVARGWLDARARQPVGEVVHDLQQRLPVRVRVPFRRADQTLEMRFHEVPTDQIRAGEEILVIEGETLGVDGIVQGGEAHVLLHATSQTAVVRQAGEPVLAGSRVVEGAIRVQATHVGDDRMLMRVTRFAERDSPSSARITRLAYVGSRYGGIAAVIGAAFGLALAGATAFHGQLAAAAAVLLAAPLLSARRAAEAPLVASAASAAARGMIFHDPRSLESAGRVTTAALCTSGTVTEGHPEIVEFTTVDGAAMDPLLALAAGAETTAPGHPLAHGILRYATTHGIDPANVRRAEFVPGRGVTAVAPNGERLVIGNRQLLLDEGISVALADAEATRAEQRGNTALFLGLGGRVRAVIALRDEIRTGSRAAVQRMFDQRMEVVLLSGDHRSTVEAMAKTLDVTHVKAELVPAERGEEVRRLSEAGGSVATIGRPGTDDDALSAANVPVCLGDAGAGKSDRGIVLATVDLRDAAAALWIARATRTEVNRALMLAVSAGGMLVAGAAMGWVVPAIAALFSVAVEAYSLPTAARLLRRIELRVPAR